MRHATRGLEAYLGRSRDRRMEKPAGLLYWIDDVPSIPATLGLALQHIAIQAIYFVLPIAAAASVTQDPAEVTRFLCLSVLAAAILQVLQLLTRGPIGAGYAIPGTHTAACLSAYMLTGELGGGFGGIAAMVCLTGIAALVVTFAMHRLRVLLPNEVAGVVVILIGVALIGLAVRQLGLQPGGTPRDATAVGIVLASIAVMMAVGLSRTRAAPFAVLIGALAGVVLSLLLGETEPNAAAILAARPWLAPPQPYLPDFGKVSAAPMMAYLLALVAIQATAAGALVVYQRAADAGWTKPDTPPLRRGLVANALSIIAAGVIGGAVPGPATAAVGLSIATGTLARRIVWTGAALLAVLALCPKVMALFVLTPAPVKAAMLLYVSGFIMAQGCQLTTARLLDIRRMMIVAAGLSAGELVALAPDPFMHIVPAIASPLSFGAVVAFVVNLVTLPLVSLRVTTTLELDLAASRKAHEWLGALAGKWGLKQATAQAADRALVELTELLTVRGVPRLDLLAQRFEDRIELALTWRGEPLPVVSTAPSPEELLGPTDAQEGFMVWLATRGARHFTQRQTEAVCEARLEFED